MTADFSADLVRSEVLLLSDSALYYGFTFTSILCTLYLFVRTGLEAYLLISRRTMGPSFVYDCYGVDRHSSEESTSAASL